MLRKILLWAVIAHALNQLSSLLISCQYIMSGVLFFPGRTITSSAEQSEDLKEYSVPCLLPGVVAVLTWLCLDAKKGSGHCSSQTVHGLVWRFHSRPISAGTPPPRTKAREVRVTSIASPTISVYTDEITLSVRLRPFRHAAEAFMMNSLVSLYQTRSLVMLNLFSNQ